jgi:hypothetical protein
MHKVLVSNSFNSDETSCPPINITADFDGLLISTGSDCKYRAEFVSSTKVATQFVWSDGARFSIDQPLQASILRYDYFYTHAPSHKHSGYCKSLDTCEISHLDGQSEVSVTFTHLSATRQVLTSSSPLIFKTRKSRGHCSNISDGRWFVDSALSGYNASEFINFIREITVQATPGDWWAISETAASALCAWTATRPRASFPLSENCAWCLGDFVSFIVNKCRENCHGEIFSKNSDCQRCKVKGDLRFDTCAGYVWPRDRRHGI